MRSRERILASLETLYRESFERARERGEEEDTARLDFEFARDQVFLEVLLDLRDLLLPAPDTETDSSSLLERAEALKRLARLRRL